MEIWTGREIVFIYFLEISISACDFILDSLISDTKGVFWSQYVLPIGGLYSYIQHKLTKVPFSSLLLLLLLEQYSKSTNSSKEYFVWAGGLK